MIDLTKYTRSLPVKGQDRTFSLSWQSISGPEAVENSEENSRLQGFAQDLAHKIVQDCAALTSQAVRFTIAEGTSNEYTAEDHEIDDHWRCRVMSPDFNQRHSQYLQGEQFKRRTAEVLYYYAASLPKKPSENYCGIFYIRLDLLFDRSEDPHAIEETMERILCLTCMRYQQSIIEHYADWETTYINKPEIYIDPKVL